MHYVYLIRSVSHPEQTYVGCSGDLRRRMSAHNAGESKHTAKYLPWQLVSYHAFSDKAQAHRFEQYLKTGSGQAFAKKRFW